MGYSAIYAREMGSCQTRSWATTCCSFPPVWCSTNSVPGPGGAHFLSCPACPASEMGSRQKRSWGLWAPETAHDRPCMQGWAAARSRGPGSLHPAGLGPGPSQLQAAAGPGRRCCRQAPRTGLSGGSGRRGSYWGCWRASCPGCRPLGCPSGLSGQLEASDWVGRGLQAAGSRSRRLCSRLTGQMSALRREGMSLQIRPEGGSYRQEMLIWTAGRLPQKP